MHTDGIVPGGTGCAFSRCTNELATIYMYICVYIYIYIYIYMYIYIYV